MTDEIKPLVPQSVVDQVEEALAEEAPGRTYFDYLIATDNIEAETVERVLAMAEDWDITPDRVLRRAIESLAQEERQRVYTVTYPGSSGRLILTG